MTRVTICEGEYLLCADPIESRKDKGGWILRLGLMSSVGRVHQDDIVVGNYTAFGIIGRGRNPVSSVDSSTRTAASPDRNLYGLRCDCYFVTLI